MSRRQSSRPASRNVTAGARHGKHRLAHTDHGWHRLGRDREDAVVEHGAHGVHGVRDRQSRTEIVIGLAGAAAPQHRVVNRKCPGLQHVLRKCPRQEVRGRAPSLGVLAVRVGHRSRPTPTGAMACPDGPVRAPCSVVVRGTSLASFAATHKSQGISSGFLFGCVLMVCYLGRRDRSFSAVSARKSPLVHKLT